MAELLSRRRAVALPLVLLAGGCGHPGGVPGDESLGGATVNGRWCLYYSADRQVEFALLFDRPRAGLDITAEGSRLSNGQAEYQFRARDGVSFAARYRPGADLDIDGKSYPLGAGRVFLVRLAVGGNGCDQLPVVLPPRAGGPLDEGYVRQALLNAAAADRGLAAFLGGG